jgi:Zn-dependent M28 family amino/carboxypeptidase
LSDKKYELAQEMGVSAVIFLADSWTKKYWKYVLLASSTPDLKLNNIDEIKADIPLVVVDEKTAENIFKDESITFGEIISDTGDSYSFQLRKKIKFDYVTFTSSSIVRNVIGFVEGNDPLLKNEFIALSAHYDHEGIRNEKIYYGADDNASGTSAVMEVGRRIAELQDNRRSVLTIFHTGEEKGLLGSKYFTANSEIMPDIIANINLDMVGRESIDTIFSVGSGKLSAQLYELVEKVNSETVNFVFDYKFDDPKDPQKIYYRSDHYNYAKKGIPIVFFYDYMTADYHKPTDTADKINFAKIEKVATLVTELTLRISNLDERLFVDKKEEVLMESGR